jgi:hypothetical protein
MFGAVGSAYQTNVLRARAFTLASYVQWMRILSCRKAIPLKVKLAVAIAQARCPSCGDPLVTLANTQFDHRPALVARPEKDGDYDPPQNDPDHIEAIHKDCHLWRTTGRKPGATKTVTTRNSDVGEAARTRGISAAQAEFRRRILHKEPGRSARPKSKWPKRKLR